jgi:hypothetical protein
MSSLAEIEKTVATLPRREQEVLLRHLAAKLRLPWTAGSTSGEKKSWPVAPPKVDKAESRRVMQRIKKQFDRIEGESWE